MDITIGIPAYNEENNISEIIKNLQKITNKIIVCDDGSSDSTATIAKEMGALVVKHETNLGYGAAIRSIFLKAREEKSEFLITLDSDGQHRIEDISTVLDPLKTGKADIVIGSRFLNNDGKNVPSYRKAGIKILTKLANTSLEKNITDSQSGFRGYGKNVIENITPSESGMGVSNEILIKASKKGLKIVEVPIIVLYDGDTSTHNPISHGSSVLISTLKFISMEHPLKFYGIPGFVFLLIGLGFLIFTINLFTETRQILLSSAIIGVGSTIFGIILIQSSILLYAMVKLMRNKKFKKN
ncbi:glycosyltransferase family 2 protein [Nitrosopumilus sp.]|nr:glycosyltransferase family 2 protein [Nitrosopumilus sp.]